MFIRDLADKREFEEFSLFTVKTKDIPSLLQLNTKLNNFKKEINSHGHILEQYIKPALNDPDVAAEKLKLKEAMPGPVVDHVFKLALCRQAPNNNKTAEIC